MSKQTGETVAAPQKKKRWPKVLIGIGSTVLALILAALVALPFFVMDMFQLNKPVVFEAVYAPEEFGLEAQEIALKTEDGLRLQAWQVNAAAPRACLVFVSGIQNPSVTAYFPHAAWLQQEGYSSILLEMRAHGGSEGDKIALGMEEYLDVKAAVQYSKAENPSLPVVVFGVSMGGATAINAFGEVPQIDGLISLSAYSTWTDAFCHNMEEMGLPKAFTAIERPFIWLQLGVSYGFSSLKVNPLAEIEKHNGRPALLMHSTQDSQVPFSGFEALREKIPQAETFVREGDHHMILGESEDAFFNPASDAEYAQAILGFLQRNFG